MTVGNLASIPSWMLVVLGVVAVTQISLDVIALIDLYRRDSSRVTLGNKWAWVAIILLLNLVGAILYLAIGRKPAPQGEEARVARQSRETTERIADALYGPRDRSGAE